MSATATLAPLWSVLSFIGLWLLVTGLLSRVGGWASLATRFRAPWPAGGDNFRFVSGSVGKPALPVGYRNCLSVHVDDRGFGLALLFLFRFQCPPLFIPWSQVESVTEREVFFARCVVVRLRDQWPAISLRGPAGRRLQAVHAALLSGRVA
jgi:hypothetical protein